MDNYGFDFYEVERIERTAPDAPLGKVWIGAWNGSESIERLADQGDPIYAQSRRQLASLRNCVILSVDGGVVIDEEWVGIDF